MASGPLASSRAPRGARTHLRLALPALVLAALAACATGGPAAKRAAEPAAPEPIARHAEVVVYAVDAADSMKARAGSQPTASVSGPPVPVRVIVFMPDWIVGGIASPVNYPVLVIGPANDSTVARTDENGIATFTLRPAHYRIAPLAQDPVARRERFEWNVGFDVRPGMRAIQLTEENATRRRTP